MRKTKSILNYSPPSKGLLQPLLCLARELFLAAATVFAFCSGADQGIMVPYEEHPFPTTGIDTSSTCIPFLLRLKALKPTAGFLNMNAAEQKLSTELLH